MLSGGTAPVVFVTGVGGQGKSTLAARLTELVDSGEAGYEKWDWRDCRDETLILRTQVALAIERVSEGSVPAGSLSDAPMSDLADALFDCIGSRRWLLVFDNVDRYVSIAREGDRAGKSRVNPELGLLVQAATRRRHSSRLVLTCRQEVEPSDARCLPLALRALSSEETVEFFRRWNIGLPDGELRSVALEAHRLTEGHPLWSMMIVRRFVVGGPTQGRQLLANIRDGRRAEDIPEDIMSAIWTDLTDGERKMISRVAVLHRPFSRDRLAELLRGQFPNFKRFNKPFTRLKGVGLLVERGEAQAPTYDLHPLIRHFLFTHHSREMQDHRSAMERFLDDLLTRLEKVTGRSMERDVTILALEKAEVAVDAKRGVEAFPVLERFADSARAQGLSEEYVRVALNALDSVNWPEVGRREIPGLHRCVHEVSSLLSMLDRRGDVMDLMERYEAAITPDSAEFVNLCDAYCEAHWLLCEYDDAIRWGRRGVDARAAANDADIPYDAGHNLALARRDSGRGPEVEAAMTYFLGGLTLERILSETGRNADSSRLGNVGRCLWFRGEHGAALRCYRLSLRTLLREQRTGMTLDNIGYAALWIAEFYERSHPERALEFSQLAGAMWRRVSLRRARLATDFRQRLLRAPDLTPTNLQDEEVERRCAAWARRDEE